MNKLKSKIFIKLLFVSLITLGSFNFVITMNRINQDQQANNQECTICYTNDPNTQLDCGHSFCSECLRTTFRPAANGQSLTSLRCPDPDCRREINNNTLRRLGFNNNHLENIANLRRPVQVYTSDPFIRRSTKPCPRCYVPIEKNDGCLHMTCTICRHDFYWCCLKPWPFSGHGGGDVIYGRCYERITNEEAHNRYNSRNIQSNNNRANRPNQARPINQPNRPIQVAQADIQRHLNNIFEPVRNLRTQENNLFLRQEAPTPPNIKKPIAIIAAMTAIGGYVWYKSKKIRTATPKNTKDQIEKVNLARHVTEQAQKAKLTKKENQKTYLGKAYSAVSSTSLKIIKLPITIKNSLVNRIYKK